VTTPRSLSIIRDEHRALAALLQSMSMLLDACRKRNVAPDFALLRAMLFYIDEYPERRHHPKEEELLFPRVRARCPSIADVLDTLSHDHDQGERSIRELEHALLAWEVVGEPRRAAFETALQRYTAFYLRHMALEERHVLTAAEDSFDADDWAVLDAALATNRDPLTGCEADDDFGPIWRRIVDTMPEPIGLGPPISPRQA
jgi:hemerythrin-like domain-containing protein